MEEECPICNEEHKLKELGKCRLQESKHKVCEECYNKSKNKCWLCGDRMEKVDIRITEIGENVNNQIVIIGPNDGLSFKITLINYMCITLVFISVICVIIVFAKLIEYGYCSIFTDEDCNISNLSIGAGYYIYASLSVLIWVAIIIKCFIHTRNN